MTQLMEPPRATREPAERRPSLLTVPILDDDIRPFPRHDSKLRRKIVPVLAVVVIVMAYLYATAPFTFAGAVECRPNGLAGARPAPGTPAGVIVGDAAKRCAEASGSRVATAGAVAIMAAVIGVAGAVAPSRAEVEARRGAPQPPAGGNGSSPHTPDAATP